MTGIACNTRTTDGRVNGETDPGFIVLLMGWDGRHWFRCRSTGVSSMAREPLHRRHMDPLPRAGAPFGTNPGSYRVISVGGDLAEPSDSYLRRGRFQPNRMGSRIPCMGEQLRRRASLRVTYSTFEGYGVRPKSASRFFCFSDLPAQSFTMT